MKTLILVPTLLALCACNATTFHVKKPDGSEATITNSRWFWKTGNYSASLSTNGTASLSASESGVDAAAIQAAASGAAQGAAAGLSQAH